MSDIHAEAQDAYAYMTRRAPWWPTLESGHAWDHVAYVGTMAVAYVEAALWSSSADDETPLDVLPTRIPGPEWAAVAMTCAYFYVHNARDLLTYRPWSADAGQAGHDMWLTRNHHGAGFWDHNSKRDADAYAAGQRLTTAAHALGEAYAYLADDGVTVYGLASELDAYDAANGGGVG